MSLVSLPQATQRVAAIVTGGTRDVRVLTADLVPAAGVAQTHLAQLLAPPREPGGGWWIIVVLVGLLFFSVPASCLVTLLIINLISLQQRSHPAVLQRLQRLREDDRVVVTIITVEEQIRGRLEIIRRHEATPLQVAAYTAFH